MPRYRFTQRYRSSYGAGTKGEEIDCDEAYAADINRDAPGTLEAIADEPEPDYPEERAVEKPAADRMHRGGSNRSRNRGGG